MQDYELDVPRRFVNFVKQEKGGQNLGIWIAYDEITRQDVIIKFGVRQIDVDIYVKMWEKIPSIAIKYISHFRVDFGFKGLFYAIVMEKMDGDLFEVMNNIKNKKLQEEDINLIEFLITQVLDYFFELIEVGYLEKYLSLDNVLYKIIGDEHVLKFTDFTYDNLLPESYKIKSDEINQILHEFKLQVRSIFDINISDRLEKLIDGYYV